MEISKSVKDDEENKAKDVKDSHFSMEERNKRSNKTFENSVTDIDKHGQQSRITNDFRDPYDGHEVQSSGMDSSKCVAKELDKIPSSSNNKNLNYIDVCEKYRELPNLSASNLNTTIDSRESSTLSSVGFKKEGFSILDLSSIAYGREQFSFNSIFPSGIGNMPEMPCDKMKASSEKTQGIKSESRKYVIKSDEQVAILERYYLRNNYPGRNDLECIAIETKLYVSSVYEWFKTKRHKERGKERLKVNNLVHLSEGEQSSDVQKVSTPIINDEKNRQFQVNPRNTFELGNRTKGNSSTCTVENVTAQQHTDKCDNNPKKGLKIDEYIAASSSTAEVVTTEENYFSRSPLREKLCTDIECPLDLSMPKKSGTEI